MAWGYVRGVFVMPPRWESPAEFALLLALADQAPHFEGSVVKQSYRDLSARCAASRRTIARTLDKLHAHGLIAFQRRTSGACVEVKLVGVPYVRKGDRLAPFNGSEVEFSTGSKVTDTTSKGDKFDAGKVTDCPTPLQYVPEPYRAAASPRTPSELAREPNDDNFRVIAEVARSILVEHPELFDDRLELREATKDACAAKGIDYGAHPDVGYKVLEDACRWGCQLFAHYRNKKPATNGGGR